METKSITRALRASPILTIAIASLLIGGGLAVSRYLLTIQSTLDITIESNPYSLSLEREGLPVTDIIFVGTVYVDDLEGQTFDSLAFWLLPTPGHAETIYCYIEIEGLTDQTINIYKKNGEWLLFDQLTSENPVTLTPLVFEAGLDWMDLRFGITDVYATTALNTLTVNFYAEDALRP